MRYLGHDPAVVSPGTVPRPGDSDRLSGPGSHIVARAVGLMHLGQMHSRHHRVELRGFVTLTFSLRMLRPPAQALSAHVHIGACGASGHGHWQIAGEHGANTVDLEPVIRERHCVRPPVSNFPRRTISGDPRPLWRSPQARRSITSSDARPQGCGHDPRRLRLSVQDDLDAVSGRRHPKARAAAARPAASGDIFRRSVARCSADTAVARPTYADRGHRDLLL